MRNAYDKWLAGEGCCNANNFIHIESSDCKKEDVCECERILLEISNLHTDDLVLQEQIDEISGDVENKLDISAYTPTDLSDYYTKEQVDALIPEVPSLSGYATEQWVLDKHYITGVDLSDYATKEEIPSLSGYATEQWVENKGYLTEHQPLKTINGQVISGTGNIEIEASGSPITVDSALSFISTNPVQNKVITEALNDKLDASAYTPTDLTNYVTISELNQYILNLQEQINSLTSAISGCCGSSGETQYRWITETGENDYWCSGTTKMSMEKEQSSSDGINWTDTGNIRNGSTVLEYNCVECGYVPPTPTATTKARLYFSYETGMTNVKVVNSCSSNITKISYYKNNQWHHITGCSNTIEPSIDAGTSFNVIMHTNTTYINNNQFKETDLSGVCSVDFITNIGSSAFENCSGITNLILDGNALGRIDLEAIGNNAFKNCSGLINVNLTDNTIVPTLGIGAFDGCNNLREIYVKQSLVESYKSAPGWTDYASLIQGLN